MYQFDIFLFIFSSLSVSASDLISRLVRGDVCRSEQIKSHPFFKGVNWNEVSCTQFSYTESSGSLVSGSTPKSPRTLGTYLYAKPPTQPEVFALVPKGVFVYF